MSDRVAVLNDKRIETVLETINASVFFSKMLSIDRYGESVHATD